MSLQLWSVEHSLNLAYHRLGQESRVLGFPVPRDRLFFVQFIVNETDSDTWSPDNHFEMPQRRGMYSSQVHIQDPPPKKGL